MSITHQTEQVGAFLDLTGDVPAPSSTDAQGFEQVRVPFKSSYKLTREQEDRLMDRALERIQQLENEAGRYVTENLNWYESTQELQRSRWTFFGRRHLYELSYMNRVEWRKWLLGGIFLSSNLCAPLSRRIARQMTARANNYFFATDPWFSVYPVGPAEREMADAVEKYSQFKLDQSGTKHVLELAIENAFVRGESVVKTTYETDSQIYKQDANVLIDREGYDVLDAHGDFILDTDAWTQELTPPGTDPQTGLAVPQTPTGRLVLKSDGVTPQPEGGRYEPKTITRLRTQFQGARSSVVYWRDILIPLAAESVQKADCVVHLSDLPVMKLISMFSKRGMGPDDEENRRVVEMLRQMGSNSGLPKSAANQARPELGENLAYLGTQNQDPIAEVAECHMRYDANQDGDDEEIMLVLDRKSQMPIFYDYEANVTPDGTRPFDVVRVNAVDGRWFGMGAMEMFETSQEQVDLQLNRINFSQSRAGRVDFWNPSCVLEGDTTPNLQLNWGGTYTLKPGKKMEDALQVMTLPDTKHEIVQNILEFFQQLMMNESGIANANDGRSAGLDSQELATGVRNIEKSGQEMFALYLSNLEPGLTAIVERNLKLIFANLQQDEVYTFFEGDMHKVATLPAGDVKELEIDVQMLLTRYKGEQVLASSMQAANLTVQFYQLTPDIQQKVAPLYRDALKALQVNFADEVIIPNPMPPPGQPMPQPGAAQAQQINPDQLTQVAQPKPTGQSPANL
jgi:hypothetical protein